MDQRSGPVVVLRPLEPSEAGAMLELQQRNRKYWQPSGPLRSDDWFTIARQRRQLQAEARDRELGRALSVGIFADGALVGRAALTSVVRGSFHNAYLGYAIDERHAGRGIATAALGQLVALAWSEGLHRVQAAVSPSNAASRRVLAKVGFRQEGLALRYLLLAGRWTDQELWAITVEDELRPNTPGPTADE